MPPQYGFQNPRLNQIKSAPALVKVTIDQDSVDIIINELERLESRIESLETQVNNLREIFLHMEEYTHG